MQQEGKYQHENPYIGLQTLQNKKYFFATFIIYKLNTVTLTEVHTQFINLISFDVHLIYS